MPTLTRTLRAAPTSLKATAAGDGEVVSQVCRKGRVGGACASRRHRAATLGGKHHWKGIRCRLTFHGKIGPVIHPLDTSRSGNCKILRLDDAARVEERQWLSMVKLYP